MDDFTWLKDSLNNIHDKMDKLTEKLSELDKTSVKQAKDIEHHIYRTDLLEENVILLREQIKPIEAYTKTINGILKFIGALSTVVGLVAAISKLI